MSDPNTVCLTREQVREIDRLAITELGIPGIVLMENASAGAARTVLENLPSDTKSVVLVCGSGNNGGDGYAIARHLYNAGVEVQILHSCDRMALKGDARINADIAFRMGIPMRPLAAKFDPEPSTCVIDALLGTGFQGELRDPLASFMEAMGPKIKHLNLPVYAIDLPSGMDANTGQCAPQTWKAQHTITFVAPKIGFQQPQAQAVLGRVHVVSIGTPPELMRRVSQAS